MEYVWTIRGSRERANNQQTKKRSKEKKIIIKETNNKAKWMIVFKQEFSVQQYNFMISRQLTLE